ncbi:MAG: YceI family protein [Pseudoxanthomonas sp.]
MTIRVLSIMLLAVVAAMAGSARAGDKLLQFDPAHSRFGFELGLRWGQKLQGRFGRYEGQVSELPDGRHQVRLRLFTDGVEIEGHPRYSEWARGPSFFDVVKYQAVEFVSEPYAADLLRRGGKLAGTLTLRGVHRLEVLEVAAADCPRPARDCDVVATGRISRADYGMDDWKLAVADRVTFVLRTRLRENAAP